MKRPVLALLAVLIHAAFSITASAQCADWRTQTGLRSVGAVKAMTLWDPDGGGPQTSVLVVAGTFDTVGGVNGAPANHVATWNGSTWTALPGLEFNSDVYALAVLHDGSLVAAGSFSSGSGHIARWDGTAWTPLAGGGLNGLVYALAVMPNGDLIAGGYFTTAGGNAAANIARWDGTTWSGILGGMNDVVTALTVMPSGRLVAAGYFTSAGGTAANRIAMWINGPVVFGWFSFGSGFDDVAKALAVMPNGDLIAGGRFLSAGGVSVNRIARWNGSNWSALGAGMGGGIGITPPDVVGLRVLSNGELVAGGFFTTADGAPSNFVARWDGSDWRPLGDGAGNWVYSFADFGGALMVGGYFSSAGGLAAQSLSRWDGLHWLPMPGVMNSDLAARVSAITTWGGGVVLAGHFRTSTIEQYIADDLALWDGRELHSIGSVYFGGITAATSIPGPDNSSNLVIGGSFLLINGEEGYNRIARVNDTVGPGWQPMGAGFADGQVRAITRHNNEIYAAGTFTLSGATAVNRIARWTGSAWAPLGTGLNGQVNALQSYNAALYVGGSFTTAGGGSAIGLARWDGANWSNLGSLPNGAVHTFAIYDDGVFPVLVVGGQFPGISGSPNLAWTDGTNWGTFGAGGTNGAVRALTVSNDTLIVGGDFTTAGGLNGTHLARFSGPAFPPSAGTWTHWTGATNGPVHALATFANEIQVGGAFDSVRNGVLRTPVWARFSEDGIPWFAEQPVSQSVDCGDNASFAVHSAAGYGGLVYQWRKDGFPVVLGPTGTGSTITSNGVSLNIFNAGINDAGTYDCVLSNACGARTSSPALLTVTDCCPADLNADGVVDLADLAALLSHFGMNSGATHADGDLDGDGDIELNDLTGLLSAFGVPCP